MKSFWIVLIVLSSCIHQLNAQEHYNTTSAGVITVEARNIDFDPISLGNILRNELIKLKLFTVVDRYETLHALLETGKEENTCYSKSCLVKVGQHLGVEKMFGGTVDRYGGQLIVSLRVIDVATGSIDHNHIEEFIDVTENLPEMIGLCLKKMYDVPTEESLWNKLTNEEDYDNTVNNPHIQRLSLSGPRMGFGVITGDDAKRFTADESQGGYEAMPVLSQFGYQFEMSYLNEGNIQALFELIPTISGLEQGLFIPSMSILHGVRSNVNGLEFAFGPVFFLTKKAKGFERDGQWFLEDDKGMFPDEELLIEERIDQRGDLKFDSGLIIAVGRTFRSGKVNFPVNLVSVLKKNSVRFGLSFGFNASGRYKR